MRPWKPHHAQDDPPKDPEIHRWFQALGPPPVGQAPPICASTSGRGSNSNGRGVACSPGCHPWGAPRGRRRWRRSSSSPWASMSGGESCASDHSRSGARQWLIPPGDLGPAGRLRTYRFQVGMAQPHDLGTLVAAHPARWDPTAVVGIYAASGAHRLFSHGHPVCDALAALHGGAARRPHAAPGHPDASPDHVQAPPALPQYLREMQTLLQQPAV